jgi:hypothetical protein
MHHNLRYQRLNGLGEMLLSVFRRPQADEKGTWMTLKSISSHMKEHFRSSFKEDAGTLEKLGTYMNRPDYRFKSRRLGSGMEYLVVER